MKTKVRCAAVGREHVVSHSQPAILLGLQNEMSAGCITKRQLAKVHIEESATGYLQVGDKVTSKTKSRILDNCSIAYY